MSENIRQRRQKFYLEYFDALKVTIYHYQENH